MDTNILSFMILIVCMSFSTMIYCVNIILDRGFIIHVLDFLRVNGIIGLSTLAVILAFIISEFLLNLAF